MNILAIDTSNHILGVSLLNDGQMLGEIVTDFKKGQTERLMPAIQFLMQEANMDVDELDRIVVAHGPGSYTGVRIGITTAKTLAWSLNIPIVAISSIELLAYTGMHYPNLICPFFDARRDSVFTGLYRKEDNRLVTVIEEQHIKMKDWLALVKDFGEETIFISPHFALYEQQIIEELGEKAVIPEQIFQYPRPSYLGLLGAEREPTDQFSLTPNYLRLAEAEAKWIEAQKDLKKNE